MINYKLLLIGLSITFLFSSCGASKKRSDKRTSKKISKIEKKSKAKEKLRERETEKVTIVTPSKKNLSTLDYIEEYAHIAVAQMQEHHIPASITLAQGILESNSGNSRLTQNSNNHFGIKCHKGWTGLRTYYDDDSKGECFRVYKNPTTSFNDHALFLTQRSRYGDLFKLNERDYQAWARGLQKAGYATDKKYPQKLIGIIEKYELYKYDEKVLGKENSVVSNANNSQQSFYIVKKGDGLYGISRKYGLTVASLKSINNLNSDTIYPGQKLYLKTNQVDFASSDPVVQVDTTKAENKVEEIVEKAVEKVEKESNTPITKPDVIYEKKKVIVENEATPAISKSDIISEKKEAIVEKVAAPSITKPDIISVKKDVIVEKKDNVSNVDTRKKVVKRAPKKVIPDFHIVKEKETLYRIAYKYELEIPDIRRWNGIKKDEISIGQRLFIKEPNSSKSIKVGNKTHTVVRGETLFSLARKNGMTVSELRELNNLQSTDIKIGQVLLIK